MQARQESNPRVRVDVRLQHRRHRRHESDHAGRLDPLVHRRQVLDHAAVIEVDDAWTPHARQNEGFGDRRFFGSALLIELLQVVEQHD